MSNINFNCEICLMDCNGDYGCAFKIIIDDFEELINGTHGKEKIKFNSVS